MKMTIKSIWNAILRFFGIKSSLETPTPVDVPVVEPAPSPSPDPVIIPTEPPIMVEPIPEPNPVPEPIEVVPEPPKQDPVNAEPVFDVKPDPKPVEQPKPEPVIIPITPKPEPVKPPVIAPKPDSLPPAAKTLKDSPLLFGVAWKDADSKREPVIKEARKHFKSYTPENAAKPWHVFKNGKFDFTNLKALVKIAQADGARVHGHACFVWPELEPSMPSQLKDVAKYKENLTSFMTTVLKAFPEIKHWDLVNEAFEDNGKLKDCTAKKVWGDNYIKEVFKIAYHIRPDAEYFLSDYNLQTDSKQATAEIAYANQMVKEGLPIHGLSSQMHITTATFVLKNYEKRLKEIAATGLKFHVSELDIKVGKGQVSEKDDKGKIIKLFDFTPALKAKQAQTYKDVVASYRKYIPHKQQHGVTFWAFTHMRNYMNIKDKQQVDFPAVFDDNFDGGLALPAILSVK